MTPLTAYPKAGIHLRLLSLPRFHRPPEIPLPCDGSATTDLLQILFGCSAGDQAADALDHADGATASRSNSCAVAKLR